MYQRGRDCNCTCINIYLTVHMHTHYKHNSLIIKQKARLYDPSIAKKGQTINHHHQDIRAPEPLASTPSVINTMRNILALPQFCRGQQS